MPPVEEEKVSTKEPSRDKEIDTTTAEASTKSTITTPFREPRVLSKFRQKQPDIEGINPKPTIKQRTTSTFKKAERLTTTRIRESTVLPTSSFRNRGNGIINLYFWIKHLIYYRKCHVFLIVSLIAFCRRNYI